MSDVALRLRLGSATLTRARSHGEITSGRTLHYRTMTAHPGGLHDPAIFGEPGGRQARAASAHIELHAPVAHPLFTRALAQVLGVTHATLTATLNFTATLPTGERGPAGVWSALQSIHGGHRPAGKRAGPVLALLAHQDRDVRDLMLWTLPVHPAGLRPVMESRGVTVKSDLNDLYRFVIRARDRLQELRQASAPELLLDTAHAELQRTVTTLITTIASTLHGKPGRIRKTLLGKRVDYSARAVITPDPHLPLTHAGLPESVARTLFEPHLTRDLRREGVPGRVIKAVLRDPAPLDADTRAALDRILAGHVILVNRAPTLHRQSLLAFTPRLTHDHTLHLHPMACEGLNADFDGDTMAIHLPVSQAAQREARELLTLSANLLRPATGTLAVTPSKDMLLGLYRLTSPGEAPSETPSKTPSETSNRSSAKTVTELLIGANLGVLPWHRPQPIRHGTLPSPCTPGQALAWQTVTDATGDETLYAGEILNKSRAAALITRCLQVHGPDVTVTLLDALKTLGFQHATAQGITVGITDVLEAPERDGILQTASAEAARIDALARDGHASPEERDANLIRHWTAVKDDISAVTLAHYAQQPNNPLNLMIQSGARASAAQLTQLSGMRGLMARPDGRTFPTPILASFRRGLNISEFFISSHGARKGSADTALRTAQAGHLTRQLVSALQHVRVTEGDCRTPWGVIEDVPTPGRTVLTVLPDGRRVVRSPLHCASATGICQACAGAALHHLKPYAPGAPIGLIAAQSLGEPGTQLTMRTFHTGGVAGTDMTGGLQHLQQLLARPALSAGTLASELQRVYAEQGVTVHPTFTELAARFIATRGLRGTISTSGWLARAATGNTTAVLTTAALHAETDPLTDVQARVITAGLPEQVTSHQAEQVTRHHAPLHHTEDTPPAPRPLFTPGPSVLAALQETP